MVSLRCWLVPLLGLVSLPQQQQAHAQYVQAVTSGYVPAAAPTPGVVRVPQWRPTVNDALQRVIDITPDLVVLEYNCYYMKDICKNADNWYKTPRGQNRSPVNRFAYDFHTGKGSTWRNQKRRQQSCGSWDSNKNCPHTDQNIVMRYAIVPYLNAICICSELLPRQEFRNFDNCTSLIKFRQDGPWQYKDLEPGTNIAEIRAKRDPQNNKIPSWVRYTCDEFPPATWIEGGSGSSESIFSYVKRLQIREYS